jgi:hypothetical protein
VHVRLSGVIYEEDWVKAWKKIVGNGKQASTEQVYQVGIYFDAAVTQWGFFIV